MQDEHKPLSNPWQRRYPPELRERATKMLLEAKDAGERCGVVSRVARQLGIEPETLHHRAARAEVDDGLRPGVPTKEKARVAEFDREVRELRGAKAVLRGLGFPSGGA